MTLRLKQLTFDRAPRIPGIRAGDLSSLDLDSPPDCLKGWQIMVRGQSVFFVSPPGWTTQTQTQPQLRNQKGPVMIHEIPRTDVFLHWIGDEPADLETALKSVKYDSPAIGPAPKAEEKVALIPPGQTGDA